MSTSPYTPQTWANGVLGDTPLASRRLNPMEDGIYNATEGVIALETSVGTLMTPAGIVQVGSGAPGGGTPTFPPIYLDDSVNPSVTWLYDSTASLWREVVSDLFQQASGAPDGLTPTFPKFYIDDSTSPYTLYSYDGTNWNEIGGSGGGGGGAPIQFGSGAPSGGTSHTIPIYADTSTTPYTLYAYNSGWELIGDVGLVIGAGAPSSAIPGVSFYMDNTTTPAYKLYYWDESGPGWYVVQTNPIQMGTGDPTTGGATTDFNTYFDTSTTPYTMYVYNGSTWGMVGQVVAQDSLVRFLDTIPESGLPPTVPATGVQYEAFPDGATILNYQNSDSGDMYPHALAVPGTGGGGDLSVQILTPGFYEVTTTVEVDSLAAGDEVYLTDSQGLTVYGKCDPNSTTVVLQSRYFFGYYAPPGGGSDLGVANPLVTVVYSSSSPVFNNIAVELRMLNGPYALPFANPLEPSSITVTGNGDGTANAAITWDDTQTGDMETAGWYGFAVTGKDPSLNFSIAIPTPPGTSPTTFTNFMNGLTVGDTYDIYFQAYDAKGQDSGQYHTTFVA